MRQLKVINLKMGGNCNLGCIHCHCKQSKFDFDRKVLQWIKDQNYDRVTFGGGEPLLYMDIIKEAVSVIGDKQYRLVTNGTLLTDEIVDFFNEHNFAVMISYDGENGVRDTTIQPRWDLIRKIKSAGFSTCCYHGNIDFAKIGNDIESLKKNKCLENIPTNGYIQSIEFPHQTKYAPNEEVTERDVEDYIKQTQLQLLYMFEMYKRGTSLDALFLLKKCLKKWWTKKKYKGCRCCNNMAHSVTIDGRFMLCPYGDTFVGTIQNGIDFEKIQKQLPTKCKKCNLWDICQNTCIENMTDNECRITHEMNAFLNMAIDEYGVKERLEKDIELLQQE